MMWLNKTVSSSDLIEIILRVTRPTAFFSEIVDVMSKCHAGMRMCKCLYECICVNESFIIFPYTDIQFIIFIFFQNIICMYYC